MYLFFIFLFLLQSAELLYNVTMVASS